MPLTDWDVKLIRNVRGLSGSGSVPSGFGVIVKGPETAPDGPTTCRTCAGVNVDGFMSRSNVTSIAPTEVFWTRLLLVAGVPGTRELSTCGPGRMSGSVS